MKSWRTTVAAIGAVLAALGPVLAAAFDEDPATVPNWGLVIPVVLTALGLAAARDNKVTSEQVGAKKP